MDNRVEPDFKAKAQPLIPEIAICRVEVRDGDLEIHAPAEPIAEAIWGARPQLKKIASACGFDGLIQLFVEGKYAGPPIAVQ